MFHIFERIQYRKRPQKGYQSCKNHRHAVDLEGDGKVFHKVDDVEDFCGAV